MKRKNTVLMVGLWMTTGLLSFIQGQTAQNLPMPNVKHTVNVEAPPRLIVRIDDMGSSEASNRASMEVLENKIATSVEVMPVCAWFPEAVRLLRENPEYDAGVHLVITSEWENVKWRPLTHCPSLTDKNGYFLPMMGPNKAYPGLAITENKWDLKEIEQEFRAQIELALRNIPQISHISGHMGSLSFNAEVAEMVKKLAAEYHLAALNLPGTPENLKVTPVSYDGSKQTAAEKEASFIRMLHKLENGKTYLFVDHPAYDNDEMRGVYHIGYEEVAKDRQGVTDLLTSEKVKQAIQAKGILLINYNEQAKALPRSTPEAEKVSAKGIENYYKAVEKSGQDLHSLMIVRNGKVVEERWFGEHAADIPHILNSVTKTFTSMAVGFAVTEQRLKVTDKVISFFPDELPDEVSPNLAAMEIKDLLTMSCGHDTDPTGIIRKDSTGSWEKAFLREPVVHKPGTKFVYNSLGTYMLSVILQRVTGETVLDYLYPRLFRPLGITGVRYLKSPTGYNTGGWGMFIKTEDMAKMGQFLLQKGAWNGKQLLPASWIEEATTAHILQQPDKDPKSKEIRDNDWTQGYGYQIWRCRHQAFRADGANGQYILVLPEKNTVIVTTAHLDDMQAELNLIWKHLLPALK